MKRLLKKLQTDINGIIGPLPAPDKWVFIVGCYNSGTTLLHDILASHPMVGSMPREGQVYTDQLISPQHVGLPRLWAIDPDFFYLDENSSPDINLNRLKRQWGARFNDWTKPVLIEKSPTNAARMRWLQKQFPNSFFIGIVRNGYAVAEGIRRKAGHPLDLAARQWLVSNEIMLRDFDSLTHRLLITYEDLTEDTLNTLNRVFEFLELGQSYAQVVETRTWQIHERDSAIRNMNERSFSVLSEDEKGIIEDIAGSLLTKFNYTAA